MKAIVLVRGVAALCMGLGALAPLSHRALADTAAPPLGPNIVVNGGFERGADPGEALAVQAGSPFVTGWTIFGSEVHVYGTAVQAEEGGRSVSMANDTTSITTGSGVSQVLTTKIGQKYQVSFYQAGNTNDHGPSTIRVQVGKSSHDYTFQEDAKANYKNVEWVQRMFSYSAIAATTPITFTAFYTPGNDPLQLDNVQVRAILTSSTAPAGGVSIKLGAATAAAGGSESISVTAKAGAALTVVVDYPDGTQAVTQAKADGTGHYSLALTLPAKVSGKVHVLVDSAGTIAQAGFTVS
jgi:choice-of-anchor C domain-containing protein